MNERSKLINLIIKDVYNGVTSDDVLEVVFRPLTPGVVAPAGIKVGDRILDATEIMQLKHEAEMIKGTRLWKLLLDRMQYHAQVRLSKDANDKDDILCPKFIIWTLQTIQETLNTLTKFESGEPIVGADGKKLKIK